MKTILKIESRTEDGGAWLSVYLPSINEQYFEDGIAKGWLEIDDNRRLTPDQRKKVYALFKDISLWSGHFTEEIKDLMKTEYIATNGKDYFSLSDMDMTTASEFIEFVLEFCFQYDIPFKTKTADLLKDLERWTYMCLKYLKCSVCGLKGEIHHTDTIGMGNNRKTLDDSNKKKLCLCRKCHTLAHAMSLDKFINKYHIKPILFKE